MIPSYRFVFQSGTNQGQIYPILKPDIVIGRDSDVDLVIRNPEISRQHARIYRQGNDLVIEDMGSTNGTFVNGNRITSPHLLQKGDQIVLGEKNTFLFEQINPDPDATVVNPVPPQAAQWKPIEQPKAEPAMPQAAPMPVVPVTVSPVPSERKPEFQAPTAAPVYQPQPRPDLQARQIKPEISVHHAPPAASASVSVPDQESETSRKLPKWAVALLILGILFLCLILAVGLITMTPFACTIYELFGYGCIST